MSVGWYANGQKSGESNYKDGKLIFTLDASPGFPMGPKHWTTIGKVTFTESMVAKFADHQLYYSHPPYNLKRDWMTPKVYKVRKP